MPKQVVVVTSAQRAAAQAMVERSAVTGRPVSESVRKIANARLVPVNGTSTAASPDASIQANDAS